jgi:hypothetical protein
MNTEDFIARNTKAIAALWKTVAPAVAKSYGVNQREFAERLAAIFSRAGGHAGQSNHETALVDAGFVISSLKAI